MGELKVEALDPADETRLAIKAGKPKPRKGPFSRVRAMDRCLPEAVTDGRFAL
jgi:hypothetical protein